MGFWQCVSPQNNKCNYISPNYNGENEGDTAQTNCSKTNATQLHWVWHVGKPECNSAWSLSNQTSPQPHHTTDVNLRCPCLIFADDFNCQNSLGAWWDIKNGSMQIEPDSPLYYGTANWNWDGSQWQLNSNNCLLNCSPATPTTTPTWNSTYNVWQPSSITLGCNGPSNHCNQCRWKWNKAKQIWEIDYGSSLWNWNGYTWQLISSNCIDRCVATPPTTKPWLNPNTNLWEPSQQFTSGCTPIHTGMVMGDQNYNLGPYCYSGSSVYGYPDANPCQPLPPTTAGTTDGQIEYISCPTTNHAVLGSNTQAILNYGKIKTNDLVLVCEVINPAPQDEIRLYFDSDKYAYFKFSTVEDGNYTPGPPLNPAYPNTNYFWPDDRSQEGQIGIYDGSQRVGHNSWACQALTSGNRWVALWIRSGTDGSQEVATAILGGNSQTTGVRGPGYVSDVAEAYVSVSNPDIGIGSGQITTGRTFIDRVSVQEGSRTSYRPALTPDDCGYTGNTNELAGGNSNNDYFGGCWGAGLDNPLCVDGIPPSEITVQISGVHGGQNNDSGQPFYTDPPCQDCNAINGTYILTRNDECWQESCEGYQYAYIGSCGCGPFTIGIEIYRNIDWNRPPYTGYGGAFSLLPCIPPLFQCAGGGIGTYGTASITSSGANGLLDCLGNDLIGANANFTVFNWGVFHWGPPNACFEGTMTITAVSYAGGS